MTMTGSRNICIGYKAQYNVTIGYKALAYVTTGTASTPIGQTWYKAIEYEVSEWIGSIRKEIDNWVRL